MVRALFAIMFCLAPAIVSAQKLPAKENQVEWVNALIGTTRYFGEVYPVIGTPWGMNYWTPQTGKANSTRIYTYDSDKIRGFRQTHLPHVALGDYGMFSIMPVTGKLRITEDDRACWFSHKYETCTPYYYSVYLGRYDVSAEMTATTRGAQFVFTFPETDSSFLVIDAFDKGSYVKIIPETREVIGYTTRFDFGKPEHFKNYFILQFDKDFNMFGTANGAEYVSGRTELRAEHALGVLNFKTKKGEQIGVKVASSFISIEQARTNLHREIGADRFELTREKVKETWNRHLGKIQILDGNYDQIRTFYSCLYRALVFPNRIYEIGENGDTLHWSPFNGKIEAGPMFAGTGFWDTFRALYPLLALLYPEVNIEMQQGLANAFKEGGWIPEWSTPGYGNVMIGTNSATAIANAYLNGLRGYDIETLYAGMLKTANNEAPNEVRNTFLGRPGIAHYKQLGFVPDDIDLYGSVARTLEYAFNDFAIYKLGKKLGKPRRELDVYSNRARSYKNLFDSSTGLMRPKNRDGKFVSPFDPLRYGGGYVEANAWQYSWSVIQDVQGLINLIGGPQKFTEKLDTLFSTPTLEVDTNYYAYTIAREAQTFKMGQYSHGNEPAQHIPYLYSYAGQPWKTQYWVREIMDRLYTATPDGYPGDEDNGQMSAWYIFSALGFYPVSPATGQYIFGSPLFKEVIVHLPNGKQITVNAPDNSPDKRYIADLRVNGLKYQKNWIDHRDILKGVRFDFSMAPVANKKRGADEASPPYSLSIDGQ